MRYEKRTSCGDEHPPFHLRHPTVPGNDFYTLCEGEHPLCMIFLPGFDHPVSREYITRYLKTLPQLKGARLVCVVRSSAQAVAGTHGSDFPFPVICDGPGVLYGYLGVEQTRGLLSWELCGSEDLQGRQRCRLPLRHKSPSAAAADAGGGPSGQDPVHPLGPQPDRPARGLRRHQRDRAGCGKGHRPHRRPRRPHCSDETLTLPDLVGWDN